ncbi:MAG: 3D domain-containing protein [Candidatus Azambacteria bacterium]|nr:3D domain-containing protein [Candidatus Azambacteria bacterium]
MRSKFTLLAVLFFLLCEPIVFALARENISGERIEKNIRVLSVTVTAYSSTHDQTDDSPFTMASGKRVYDGAIAANFLPFGTEVMLPELYDDKVFIVEDRMHRRFSNRVDIWMETREEALEFGIKRVTIKIL